MGVAAHALDAVGQIEHHAGSLAGDDAGHEFAQTLDDVHVPVEETDVVPSTFQRCGHALHRRGIIGFLVLDLRDVDDP